MVIRRVECRGGWIFGHLGPGIFPNMSNINFFNISTCLGWTLLTQNFHHLIFFYFFENISIFSIFEKNLILQKILDFFKFQRCYLGTPHTLGSLIPGDPSCLGIPLTLGSLIPGDPSWRVPRTLNLLFYSTYVLTNFPFPLILLKAQEYIGCGW